MPSKKDQKFLLWSALGIMLPGLIITICQPSIDEGKKLKIIEKGKEQQALVKKILASRKDVVVDPATGYAVCGERRKFVLKEPVIQIKMCGRNVTGKKSYVEKMKAANDYCMKTKKVCIKIYGNCRSNLHSSKSKKRRRKSRAKKLFRIMESPITGACGSAHNACQAFDVLNFDAAHECLVKFDFWGGWCGIEDDPHHYFIPETDSSPRLKKCFWRRKRNKAWCGKPKNKGCWKNNKLFRSQS